MVIYTNGFRCAANEDGEEFTLQCLQISPEFGDNHEITGTSNEVVASLVMTAQSARALAELIINSPFMRDKEPAAEEGQSTEE